ncbi:MAG: carboxymuconolactone decarboxylase family protein [Dehalococcoidia bacterium]
MAARYTGRTNALDMSMPHVDPLPRESLSEFEPRFQAVERAIGFVPNSYFTLGHRPEILRTFAPFAATVPGRGATAPVLKQLIALVASNAAGCRYCQAHTSSGAAVRGGDPAKIEAAFDFETSPLFTSAERSALRIARDAALQPNATTPAHFAQLREYFTAPEVVEIVSVIGLFGFLNRWNDTIATQLEDEPVAFASQHLATSGWTSGKHQ